MYDQLNAIALANELNSFQIFAKTEISKKKIIFLHKIKKKILSKMSIKLNIIQNVFYKLIFPWNFFKPKKTTDIATSF